MESLEALDPYYRAHACADGFVALACLNAEQRRQVCELLGLEDPFAGNPQAEPADAAERERRAAHVRAVEEGFARLAWPRPWRRWPPGGVPASEVRRLDQLFDDEQVRRERAGADGRAAGRGPRAAARQRLQGRRRGGRERPAGAAARRARGRAARSADPLMRVVSDLPRPVRRIDHVWIPLADGTRLGARIWLPGGRRGRSRAGDPRVHPLPQGRRHGAARLAAPRVLRRPRVRRAARGPARQRRVRRPAPRRVPAARAGGRARGAPLDRGPAVVHGRRGHVRHLLGRLQRPPGGGARAARAEGGDHALLDRRPLRRRRALPRRRGARARDALVGRVDAVLQRDRPRPRGGRSGLARRLARADRRRGALRVRVAAPPAPRRVLEAGLGLRGLRRDRVPGLRDRRLGGRLLRGGAAPRGGAGTGARRRACSARGRTRSPTRWSRGRRSASSRSACAGGTSG